MNGVTLIELAADKCTTCSAVDMMWVGDFETDSTTITYNGGSSNGEYVYMRVHSLDGNGGDGTWYDVRIDVGTSVRTSSGGSSGGSSARRFLGWKPTRKFSGATSGSTSGTTSGTTFRESLWTPLRAPFRAQLRGPPQDGGFLGKI